MEKDDIKQIVKKHYGEIASKNRSGCCISGCGCGDGLTNEQIAKSIGYLDKEIKTFSESNLGLGCGNPTGIGNIKEGEVVLDLGSGAGFDCFLAAEKVGSNGKVIGVDFTTEMVELARINAKKINYNNVEFRLGDIENLPIEKDSIDVVISNCVINLTSDKSKVFKEVFRVLKKGGRAFISDIVLLKDIPDEQKSDDKIIAGCVGGALLRNDYIKIVKDTGFKVKILSEDKDISERLYQGIPLESLTIELIK